MGDRVGIQTEGTRFLHLLELRGATRGTIDLTTVKDFQTRVVLKVFQLADGNRMLLDTIPVLMHDREKAGVPLIRVNGRYDGRRALDLTVSLNGQFYIEKKVTTRWVAGALKLNPFKLKWIHAPLAAIPCALILFFVLSASERPVSKTASPRPRPAGSFKVFTGAGPAMFTKVHAFGKKSGRPPVDGADADEDSSDSAPQEIGLVSDPDTETTDAQGPALSNPVIVTETVYFNSSSATLTPRTTEALLDLIETINGNPESQVAITGHCALSGSEKGRYKLSLLRASRVREFLLVNGMVSSVQPEVSGMGSTQLVTADPQEQHLNRRVEIVIGDGTE